MKTMLKSLVAAIALFLLAGNPVSAQKIGYIDLQMLMEKMPEYTKSLKRLELYRDTLQNELKKMSDEYDAKVKEYQTLEKTRSEMVNQSKREEIGSIEERIRRFSENAQEDMRSREKEMLTPIIDKAKATIAIVAKENGYSYVMDSGTTGFLYKPEADNLLEKVKAKMGIQ